MSIDEIRTIDKKIGTEVLNVIKVNNSVNLKVLMEELLLTM